MKIYLSRRRRAFIVGIVVLLGLLALLLTGFPSKPHPCLEPWTSDQVWLEVLPREPKDAADFEKMKEEMLEEVMEKGLNKDCTPSIAH